MALQKKSQHTAYEQERKYAMKKLKQMSGPYSIGFELSSTAHGFVATDPNGNVLYHGKQPVMGTRVFKEGQHAAELLANRYIDVMPEVAEAVAKPLTAVDSIKMYGDGNATKLVRDTTGMVDQVTSGLKDATGIDLTELLSSFHQPFQPREDNE